MKKNQISMTACATDSPDIEKYEKCGGYAGLRSALSMKPAEVIDLVKKSGLRGRGGAGFPTGLKWESVPSGGDAYILCNADEGEPGTFKDRYIMEKAPFLIIEGMTIAAYAVGSRKGYIYIRGEYPQVALVLEKALEVVRAKGLLGEGILGSNYSFEIEIRKGGGSYVVGDETALLSSLMGERGIPWKKPPFPTEAGLWGKPTVVNNVETLACVSLILSGGAEKFKATGAPGSPGPKLFSVSGHVNSPGIYEFPMGITVEELITAAGGVRGHLKAVQIGGTAGPVYDVDALPMQLDFDSMKKAGGILGSGALVVMNSNVNMADVLDVTMRFFSEESCGKCFACRYGTRQLSYMARRIISGQGRENYTTLMRRTAEVMSATAFCPFGQSVAMPLNSILDNFGEEISDFIRHQKYFREVG